MAIDPTDPCAAAAALRVKYYALIGGESVERVRTGDREAQFRSSPAGALLAEIERLEAQCAAKSGKRRRFAIRGRIGC